MISEMNADHDDDALLAWLKRVAAEADPMPGDITAAAREAIGLHDLDGQLAELIADSAGSTPEYDAVRRTEASDRLLSFEGGGVRVELEIVPDDGELTVIGQVIGASPEGCELEYGDGRRETLPLDDLGRFLVDRRRSGPVRIRCRSVDGSPVITSWVNL
ncbi:hypothetical protein AB0I34_31930 [Kribbella sp. NPDC050281]|uniref:hypothetical protein n=1 Tax=Kribbella sp. NPDC050281 TaxID=3155515 RepID=UPI00340754A9